MNAVTLLRQCLSQRFWAVALLLAALLLHVLMPASFAQDTDDLKWYNPASWWYKSSDKDATVQPKKSEAEVRAEKRQQKKLKDKERRAKMEAKRREKEAETAHKNAKKEMAKTEEGEIGVVIETQRGNVVVRLYEKEAPITVANFKSLVDKKFYNKGSMKFHRVEPGFVVQTGDPTGTGYGGSDKKIPLEVQNTLSHDSKGVVAMARGASPDSATSQFYITLGKHTQLDGKYAIFGRVISGLDVLDKIEKGDQLYGVKLIDISTVEQDAPGNAEDPNKGSMTGSFKKMLGWH